MADYKDIVGTAVRNNAGNLSSDQQNQIFYDSTNIDFKYQFAATTAAWRTQASMNTGRIYFDGSDLGTATATLVAGGEIPALTANTETWNGSSWSEVNNLNTARSGLGGAGTSTAALMFGGTNPGFKAVTESWNGSGWTEIADMSTGRQGLSGGATNNTAAIAYLGHTPPGGGGVTHASEELTVDAPVGAWSTGASINTARRVLGGTGIYTSALAFGGYNGTAQVANTESYNGTSWTEVNDLNRTKTLVAGIGKASNQAALCVGGYFSGTASQIADNESWNGTSWTELADINTQRYGAGNAGTPSAGLIFGGDNPTPAAAITESWNGSAWTEVADLNTARYSMASAGIATAALSSSGHSSTGVVTITESWNGSAWTEVNDLNTGKYEPGSSGTVNTAALAFGGRTSSPPLTATTEDWNGVSWVEVADLSSARRQMGSAGSSTNALAFGGETAGADVNTSAEEWSGSTTSIKTIDTD